jgi:methionyl-tRNA formyltransferase
MSVSVIFAGSPAIAVPALRAIAEAGVAVAAVLTNPDTAKGRSGQPTPTPVACCAEELGFSIIKSARIDGGTLKKVQALSPSLLVTFAYGALFPPAFLALFPLGGINCHPSLLPKHRGATPIQETILRRDAVTGITIQYLAEKMDEGDIILQEEIPLHYRETTESLSAVAAEKGARLLVEAVPLVGQGNTRRTKQYGEVSYCGKIGKEDGVIEWQQTAYEIDAQIRAFTPWPLCRTRASESDGANGNELFILEAHPVSSDGAFKESNPPATPGTVICADKNEGILIQTGNSLLAVTRLQWKAKKALGFRDFLNGAKQFVGTTLK